MEDESSAENTNVKIDAKIACTDLAYKGKHGTSESFRIDEQGCLAEVSEFEDLLEIINPNGRWNITTLAFGCMALAILPFQTVTYQFLGSTPEHWCHIDTLTEANWTDQQIRDFAIPINSNDTDEKNCKFFNYNYTRAVELGYEAAMENRDSMAIGDGSPIYCQSRDFNVSHYSLTLVAEWDLVCESRALYSTTQSVAQFGILLGDMTFPYFMAKFGRRPVILICSALSFLSGLGAAISPVYSVYILFRIAVAFFGIGYYTGCFVYTMELSSPSQRSAVGCVGGIPWSFGFLLVPSIAYLVRPWRYMQVAFSAPMLLFIAYYWIIVESPRWLIAQGRYEEAATIFSKAAKINGRAFPPSEAVVRSMEKMAPPSKPKVEENLSQQFTRNIKDYLVLILKREYRVKILINYFCWCAVSMVYYGISLNSDNLSADLYLYMVFGSLAEFPSYFLAWVLVAYIGRRISLSLCLWAASIAICVVSILLASMDEVPSGLIMPFAMAGRIAISSAFVICYMYTAELFPTRYRSLAVGQSSVMGRVGSIVSPYINDILGIVVVWAPSALFTLSSVLSAALCLFLPETRESITEERALSPKDDEKGKSGKLERKTEEHCVNSGFQDD
ncbi:organic cation/carnitine transporter 2-like [Palaemon carinicauda]|uniref:organic cation/carnitine transporter 2-like n=1 Tax=Palaemon carinicauda TaxID=392227 RepID=UPI0035B57A46